MDISNILHEMCMTTNKRLFLLNDLELSWENTKDLFIYSVSKGLAVGEPSLNKDQTISLLNDKGVSFEELDSIHLKAGFYIGYHGNQTSYISMGVLYYLNSIKNKNRIGKIIATIEELYGLPVDDLAFCVSLNETASQNVLDPTKFDLYQFNLNRKKLLLIPHSVGTCYHMKFIVKNNDGETVFCRNSINPCGIYLRQNGYSIKREEFIGIIFNNTDYITNKPYNRYIKSLLNNITELYDLSSETHFIRRKFWMLEQILKGFTETFDADLSDKQREESIQAAYAVISLLLLECQSELNLINQHEPKYYQKLLEDRPTAFSPNNTYIENMKIFAEYIIQSIESVKHVKLPLETIKQVTTQLV